MIWKRFFFERNEIEEFNEKEIDEIIGELNEVEKQLDRYYLFFRYGNIFEWELNEYNSKSVKKTYLSNIEILEEKGNSTFLSKNILEKKKISLNILYIVLGDYCLPHFLVVMRDFDKSLFGS